MKAKGFTLIELMIVVSIIGIIALMFISAVINRNSKPIVQEKAHTEIVNLSKTGIDCLQGKQIIKIDGKTYWIGNEPDTWGDLKSLPCE